MTQGELIPRVKDGAINMPAAMDQIERSFIEQALLISDGNKAAAARLLGINRTTLIEKMKRHGMPLLPPQRRIPK